MPRVHFRLTSLRHHTKHIQWQPYVALTIHGRRTGASTRRRRSSRRRSAPRRRWRPSPRRLRASGGGVALASRARRRAPRASRKAPAAPLAALAPLAAVAAPRRRRAPLAAPVAGGLRPWHYRAALSGRVAQVPFEPSSSSSPLASFFSSFLVGRAARALRSRAAAGLAYSGPRAAHNRSRGRRGIGVHLDDDIKCERACGSAHQGLLRRQNLSLASVL